MLRLLFATLITAMLAVPALAAESVEDMLLRRIAWITEHFPDLAYDGEPLPSVQSVPYENLLGMTGLEPGREVWGVYDHDTNAIFLNDEVAVDSLEAGFVIVHELVHYLQNLREPLAEVSCLRGYEPEAYAVQEQWQREFGPWPLGWNWLFVLAISDCRSQ